MGTGAAAGIRKVEANHKHSTSTNASGLQSTIYPIHGCIEGRLKSDTSSERTGQKDTPSYLHIIQKQPP